MKNTETKKDFRTIRNFVTKPSDKERPTKLKSQTVPNDAMTIHQLFERAAQRFLSDQVAREATHDDIDMEKIQNADPVDKQHAADYQRSRTEDLKKQAAGEVQTHTAKRKALEEKMDREQAERILKIQQDNALKNQKSEGK